LEKAEHFIQKQQLKNLIFKQREVLLDILGLLVILGHNSKIGVYLN
jgi:hypothetical protein